VFALAALRELAERLLVVAQERLRSALRVMRPEPEESEGIRAAGLGLVWATRAAGDEKEKAPVLRPAGVPA
jgi:hypothetical protein